MSALATRKKAGKEIEVLILERCSKLDDQAMKKLRCVAGEVQIGDNDHLDVSDNDSDSDSEDTISSSEAED